MPESNTSWTLYASNEEAWEAMLYDCSKAQKSIVLEQFIFTDDEFGRKMIDICVARAAAGVEVKFLWDAAGSFSFFGSNIAHQLRDKKVHLLFWKTLIPSYFKVPNYRSWFLRNHRRTLVIDECIGYTGSMCVRDAMKNWRDTNVRLEGPVVASMRLAFDKMWARAKGRRHITQSLPPRDPEFSYITNAPAPGKRHMYKTVLEAIRSAEQYIYITTPYFVPTHRLIRAIKLATHRGVDVRLLIPASSNVMAIDLGARSFFDSLLRSGVRIFLYNGEMIHSKTMVVDGTWSTVGSLNMDSISLLYNYEANIVSTQSKFAEELAAHFVHDISESTEVDPAVWRGRFFMEKIPETLIKLVRKFL